MSLTLNRPARAAEVQSGTAGAGRIRLRIPLTAALIVAGAAHIPVTGEHLEEAPYVGWLFVAFTVASFALAAAIAVRPRSSLLLASAALCGGAVLAYAATRLVAFPQIADDVGNWFESWGVVSVLSELGAVAVASTLLRSGGRSVEK
jgi:hypothetical protein